MKQVSSSAEEIQRSRNRCGVLIRSQKLGHRSTVQGTQSPWSILWENLFNYSMSSKHLPQMSTSKGSIHLLCEMPDERFYHLILFIRQKMFLKLLCLIELIYSGDRQQPIFREMLIGMLAISSVWLLLQCWKGRSTANKSQLTSHSELHFSLLLLRLSHYLHRL